ncbi:MAG: hypothetical protein AB7P03_18190 [Kofleriaceae bacterium]
MRWLPILAAVALATAPRAATADGDHYQVIVHPANQATTVDRTWLRQAFLKRSLGWRDGKVVRPLMLSSRFSARDRFVREVIKKTRSQLTAYWNQQIFSGKAVPPPEADSTTAAIAWVLKTPGAVAFIPVDADPGGARVVALR